MTDHTDLHTSSHPLDDLVDRLLDCGAVLSQIIATMVKFDESGRSSPVAAPIPETANALIRSVIGRVRERHSRRDIRVAASIVQAVTDAICEEIYIVAPEAFDELGAESGADAETSATLPADHQQRG